MTQLTCSLSLQETPRRPQTADPRRRSRSAERTSPTRRVSPQRTSCRDHQKNILYKAQETSPHHDYSPRRATPRRQLSPSRRSPYNGYRSTTSVDAWLGQDEGRGYGSAIPLAEQMTRTVTFADDVIRQPRPVVPPDLLSRKAARNPLLAASLQRY